MAVEELANQIFQHDGGFGVFNQVAILEHLGAHLLIAEAGGQTDVLLAEQTGGEDGEGAGIGKLASALLHHQGHFGHLGFRVQYDVADPTDHHAADLDRRTDFQAADIIEMRAQGIGFSFRFEAQTGHLQGQCQNGTDASQHEGADQEFYFAELHLYLIQT